MRDRNRWDTLVESMRSLLGTTVALLHTRLELVGIELEQELWRARSLIVWAFATLLLTLRRMLPDRLWDRFLAGTYLQPGAP